MSADVVVEFARAGARRAPMSSENGLAGSRMPNFFHTLVANIDGGVAGRLRFFVVDGCAHIASLEQCESAVESALLGRLRIELERLGVSHTCTALLCEDAPVQR